MNRKAPLRFEPEALDYELTAQERSQLVGFAIGRAVLWAACAGAVWFAFRGFVSSEEPAFKGIIFIALVFVVVFFWKRRTYRREMAALMETMKRNQRNATNSNTQSIT
jgi:hypothetical protein